MSGSGAEHAARLANGQHGCYHDASMIAVFPKEANCGAIAQLGERIVRNDEVVGSIPTSSTKSINNIQAIQSQSRSISLQSKLS
jgi:hypothetical protein